MRIEKSAGGVVIYDNAILLLRKYNGDWVLPKGRIEKDEKIKEAALREVKEETGTQAEVIKYLGEIHYTYNENWYETNRIHKTVHWFMMKSSSLETVPQKEEGFVEARYIQMDKAIEIVKYDDEREIIKVAVSYFKKGEK